MKITKTNDVDYICEGCKRAVNQSIARRKGGTVNCCAYGCATWFSNPCGSYDIFRYTYERLKEEGMLKDDAAGSGIK